jgi:hypothetical protein
VATRYGHAERSDKIVFFQRVMLPRVIVSDSDILS